MKPDSVLKHIVLAFALALIGYAVFYQGIEYRRTRQGPWQVTFTQSASGSPAIVIGQPRLGITNVQIVFSGESYTATNASGASATEPPQPHNPQSPVTSHASPVTPQAFGQARAVPYAVPFGECVFQDTTFLPGTVTFRLFGHEIELLPRVLIIDRQEHAWEPNATINLPRAQQGQRPLGP